MGRAVEAASPFGHGGICSRSFVIDLHIKTIVARVVSSVRVCPMDHSIVTYALSWSRRAGEPRCRQQTIDSTNEEYTKDRRDS